ncbi:hypothetical protein [Serratia sp. Se-RSBMAAmG]|uniref:hypothetical protein n=1 Tax=Serratia sp. Se-RSBMAAmG TaxID=3043305 RepID=UPI0024AEFAB8|nr:hypothetical protein [Serratia sp. Se-RSBMAAmG]MDI6976004.1 hypothetical protein [Serratia sp. Se-RSBMAAmG]
MKKLSLIVVCLLSMFSLNVFADDISDRVSENYLNGARFFIVCDSMGGNRFVDQFAKMVEFKENNVVVIVQMDDTHRFISNSSCNVRELPMVRKG